METPTFYSPEARLKSLGTELPATPKPASNYVTSTQSGHIVFFSGQRPIVGGKVVYQGRVGTELTDEEGYLATRLTMLNSLAILREHAGSFDLVTRILKLLAWVQCEHGFQRQHLVLNGASDLLVEVFGNQGRHARSAVSAHDLPFNIAIEIELIAELDSVL